MAWANKAVQPQIGGIQDSFDGGNDRDVVAEQREVADVRPPVVVGTDPFAEAVGEKRQVEEEVRRLPEDRGLPVDAATARRWGELSAGRSIPVIDTLIAATAIKPRICSSSEGIIRPSALTESCKG